MAKTVHVSRAVLVLLSIIGTWSHEGEDKDVHVLTKANFDEFVKARDHTLVIFYAPWCGHCKKMMPHFAEAATKLKENGKVALAKVDATVEKDLAERYDVSGYPTVKFFSKLDDSVDFTGGRTAEGIIKWIETMMGPAVQTTTEDQIESLKAEGTLFVARLQKVGSEEQDVFSQVAKKRRLIAKFVEVIDAANKNTVTVYRPDDDAVGTSLGKVDDVLKWIDEERFPTFGPIDGDMYPAYEKRGLDMVFFASSKDDYTKHGPEMRAVAKDYRDTYSFVWVDTDQYGGFVEGALGVSKYPSLVLRKKENARYIYPGTEFVAKDLKQFVEDVGAGKIQKHLKSEEIPERTDDPVEVVVGKNFEKVVFQEGKDVMIEFYAPWCGHCKKLAPIYTELAEKLKGVDHVVIAKMDATANEPPVEGFDFRGFPSIFWVKAGKREPETYSGDRTFEGLMKYIKENSSKPVVTAEPAAEKEEKAEEKEEL